MFSFIKIHVYKYDGELGSHICCDMTGVKCTVLQNRCIVYPPSVEFQFIVLNGGIKLTMAFVCRTGLSGYIGWRAGTTTLCHSRLYPPSQDYELELYIHGRTMNLATVLVLFGKALKGKSHHKINVFSGAFRRYLVVFKNFRRFLVRKN